MLGRVSTTGVLAATAFCVLAMTPSLLPRTFLYQGLVCGISAALGYGAGVGVRWVVRTLPTTRRWLAAVGGRVPPPVRGGGRVVLLVACAVLVPVVLAVSVRWQQQLALALGAEPPSTGRWLLAAPVLLVVAAVLVLLGRVLRVGATGLSRLLRRHLRLPDVLAGAVGTALVAAGVLVVVNDVLLARTLSAADEAFSLANSEDHPGVVQPTAATRSGSPDSAVPWETLGREGRRFVSGGAGGAGPAGPAAGPAGLVAEPVRVYTGLDSAPSAEERAALVASELERAGGLQREVVLVVTTTGSGWVNGAAVGALERMHGGDTATVASQYSYLPSWLSFLLDRSRAEEESRAVFEAVEARVDALPEAERPRLLVYGESLGSAGSEAVFGSLAAARDRTDGVLWTGPPASNDLWGALVARRDPGTTPADPVYADGLVVRFADSADPVAADGTPWLEPRVLYLQNASDPVVWWSPDLLFQRPDWLAPGGSAGTEAVMTWFPVVTFWQVTFDLLNAKDVPATAGHNYDGAVRQGWEQVAQPQE